MLWLGGVCFMEVFIVVHEVGKQEDLFCCRYERIPVKQLSILNFAAAIGDSAACVTIAVVEVVGDCGERGDKEGEEDGGREEGEGNEEKGGYPTAHREFVERIKENQGKLEEAMAPLVVEALGLSGLRFVKAETEVCESKQHPMKPEVCSSSPSNGIQQENRRAAEEEAADGSLGITSDGSSEGVRKDEKHVEIPTNVLATNKKSKREGSSIDLEKEKKEEEEEEEEE
ncbi:uncharacterized protein MONOS_15974 [Monocercomonoides exilis]|uniref:uncharacterized protein n=1 Tax=Monocercomonoides exilis TaxID=2049356 RepID=UPI00355AAC14|nr:hypothetical protein MONOS_15974 [Monocercomonoides exilis]|eukprot:MONOS_15974.1-p1 / transcript=MONOS_15974.1 / gene=MONOS_15974 / organism=Monocercomonoides_exilis_PA203 / gene_product=unspecified product / transcript_product=unspecified product / location=Mono_scaffold01434:1492-2305(+) / protein_length=228 / sequence_SO=supercontig / SO=protein_coding / is_pseudo=false